MTIYTHDGKDLPLRVIVKMASDWPYATDDTCVFDPTCSVSAQGSTVLCGFSAYHNREDTRKAAFHCQRCEPKGNEKVHSSVIHRMDTCVRGGLPTSHLVILEAEDLFRRQYI